LRARGVDFSRFPAPTSSRRAALRPRVHAPRSSPTACRSVPASASLRAGVGELIDFRDATWMGRVLKDIGDQASVSSVATLCFQRDLHVASSPPVAIHSLFGFPARFLGPLTLAAVQVFCLAPGDLALGDAVAEVYPQGITVKPLASVRPASLWISFLWSSSLREPRVRGSKGPPDVLGDVGVD